MYHGFVLWRREVADVSKNLTKENKIAGQGERQSNIELFRIVVMFFIIAHHYVVNSNLVAANGPIMMYPKSGATIFLVVFGAWGKICINCFVFITGYFMCTQNISAKKFVKLLLEVLFYKIVIGMIFIASGNGPDEIIDIVKLFLPITEIGKNFTDTFLLFYLFIPFLNKALHSMKEIQHFKLLVCCVFVYVILGTNPKMIVNYNYITWFMVVYVIASYVRLYPKAIYDNIRLWSCLLAANILACVASVLVCTWLGASKGGGYWYIFVTDCNTFLAVSTAMCAFMFFKNLKIGYSRIINTVSASTFGVFLIHSSSDTMRNWLWNELFDVSGVYGARTMPIYAVGAVLTVFAVCSAIDICRIRLLETPFFALWDRQWQKINRAYMAFEQKICSKLHIDN